MKSHEQRLDLFHRIRDLRLPDVATIMFLAKRFSDVYRADQAAADDAPQIVMDGNVEVFAKPAE